MYETNRQPIYNPAAVQPMRDELTRVGFQHLLTPEDVDKALLTNDGKTTLVFINSVCGCAAGTARPGAALALQNSSIPDKMVTVFAGMERDAVDYFRGTYTAGVTPSSPCMFLFKDGKLISSLERFQIERKNEEQVANLLIGLFDENCSNEGPSIPEEEFSKLGYIKMCGSKVPLNN